MVTYKWDLRDNGIYREGLRRFGFFIENPEWDQESLRFRTRRCFFKGAIVCKEKDRISGTSFVFSSSVQTPLRKE